MIFLDAFDVTRYITHPISLVAYIAAVITTFFISRNINDRRKIESVKEDDRASVIIKTAERLHLDISAVPESERAALIRQSLKNRIYLQIIFAVVIIILGILIAWVINKQISSPNQNIKPENQPQKTIDSVAYIKTQNMFSVIGIDLEGQAVEMLIDSNRISEDWEAWLQNKPTILFNATGTYDTLKKLKNEFFSGSTNSPYEERGQRKFYFTKNDKILKGIKAPASKKRMLGLEPNEESEFAFPVNVNTAISVFGFDNNCFVKKEKKKDNYDPIGINNCATYLKSPAVEWLWNHRSEIGPTGVGNGYSGYQSIIYYSYLARRRIPDQFILLQNYTKFVDDCIGDWPENDNDVVMHYSTPLMKIHCIVIKNNSSETITINSLKLIQTHSDSLRSKNEDAAFSTKSKAITTQIKIAPNSDIVIPASISFTPLNKIKPPNTDISFKSDAESYYYGEVSYLDSLTINGFTFPFKQFADRIVLMGFRDGKTFSTDGSCPYLYSYVPSNKHYALEKQILYKLNSKEKEKYDTILLKNPNRKMLIKEIDPEDSFIDQIFILCVDKNKKETRYFSNNDLLKKKDGKYLQLSTNDQVFLEFENFISVNDNNKYYLVSNGYYLPHKGKSNYVKPAPTIIH